MQEYRKMRSFKKQMKFTGLYETLSASEEELKAQNEALIIPTQFIRISKRKSC